MSNLDKNIARGLGVIESQNPDISWVAKDTLVRVAQEVKETFERDIESLRKDAYFLQDETCCPECRTERAIDMFRGWHNKTSHISLLAIVSFAIEMLNIKPDSNLQTALLMSAMLGEIHNKPAYHSNMHFREVTFQALRIIKTHNDIYKGTPKILSDEDMSLLIIAASIHDLGHTGQGNVEDGVHITAKMELHSYTLAEPYLKKCGLDSAQLQKIKTMIIATDSSPVGSEDAPVNQMKCAYKYHNQEGEKLCKPILSEGLLMLEKDANLTLISLFLHEADISISAGLNYDVTCYETTLLWEEMGRSNPCPSDVINFLDKICHGRFLSKAGKICFASNMAQIYTLAEDAVKNGDRPFCAAEHSNFILDVSDDAAGKTVK